MTEYLFLELLGKLSTKSMMGSFQGALTIKSGVYLSKL
jgi:hypothetical protein